MTTLDESSSSDRSDSLESSSGTSNSGGSGCDSTLPISRNRLKGVRAALGVAGGVERTDLELLPLQRAGRGGNPLELRRREVERVDNTGRGTSDEVRDNDRRRVSGVDSTADLDRRANERNELASCSSSTNIRC